MNEEKISSSDVPRKFADWLLSMGCPPEKIPHNDKLPQMCRGQYYMVWRSMMEHVEPKDTIKQKRLQVFCDDVYKYKNAHSLDNSVIVPPEVLAWKKYVELKNMVRDAEYQVAETQTKLSHAMDKVSGKLAQRDVSRSKLCDAQRRVWCLQTFAEQLRSRREHLKEIRSIADEICKEADPKADVQGKLDKCLSVLTKQIFSPKNAGSLTMSGGKPIASSSVMSATIDSTDLCEEQLSTLTDCPAPALWSQLVDRRMNLLQLSKARTDEVRLNAQLGITSQSINTYTALLHFVVSEEDIVSSALHQKIQQDIASAIAHLNNELTTEGCELLVLSCERVQAEAKLLSRKELLRVLLSGEGCFASVPAALADNPHHGQLKTVDRNIVTLKADFKKLMSTVSKTEKKIQKVSEFLSDVFKGFRSDVSGTNKYKDLQLDLPEDILSTCEFYQQHRERRHTDLSLKLDSPENSFDDVLDNPTAPTLTDEINVYLGKFNLEQNRKLVLDNGEKIWIFETLQSSISRLHSRCLSEDISCGLVCPSDKLSGNLARVLENIMKKIRLSAFIQSLEQRGGSNLIDINFAEVNRHKEHEKQNLDKIKKKLNENIISLQKTSKVLSLGKENLEFWSKNVMRKYVSPNRTVDSKSYKEYEALYLNSLNPIV